MKVPLSARDRGSLRYPPPGPPRLGPGGRSRLFRGSSSCQQNGSLPSLPVSVFPRVLPLFGLSPVPGRFPFFSRLRFSRGGAGGRIPAPLPGGARRMPETAFPAMRIRAGRPELPCAGSVVLHLPVRPGQRFSCYSVIHIVPPCCCDDNGIWPVFPSSSDVFPLRILTFTAIPGRSPPPGRDGIGPGNSESDLSLAPAVRLLPSSSGQAHIPRPASAPRRTISSAASPGVPASWLSPTDGNSPACRHVDPGPQTVCACPPDLLPAVLTMSLTRGRLTSGFFRMCPVDLPAGVPPPGVRGHLPGSAGSAAKPGSSPSGLRILRQSPSVPSAASTRGPLAAPSTCCMRHSAPVVLPSCLFRPVPSRARSPPGMPPKPPVAASGHSGPLKETAAASSPALTPRRMPGMIFCSTGGSLIGEENNPVFPGGHHAGKSS